MASQVEYTILRTVSSPILKENDSDRKEFPVAKNLKQKHIFRYLFIVTGNACKERWTRIRDNHRKALNLRKRKSGQAASKIKAPKFSQELSFLTPYLNDEEEWRSNLSPRSANNNEETQLESLNELGYPDNNVSSDAQSEQSMQSVGSS
ncbi:unnamed protein product [Parnassius apollo]|uniref:(apollo) hypothetical protein n=1 Tax=Parnassius apollo TaxID=110799 RepID=A0A8S3XI72_PARAO|nr:unnamed protein product [Parnassius apollo]